MSTRSGACVARARLAATLGRPMPTKQVMPSRRARAAATAIISSAPYPPDMPASDPSYAPAAGVRLPPIRTLSGYALLGQHLLGDGERPVGGGYAGVYGGVQQDLLEL